MKKDHTIIFFKCESGQWIKYKNLGISKTVGFQVKWLPFQKAILGWCGILVERVAHGIK